jgi:hypothetical protein
MPEAGQAVADSREAWSGPCASGPNCGMVVTTGGVGGRDKDWSVEAIEALDPHAATPYLTVRQRAWPPRQGRRTPGRGSIGTACGGLARSSR